MTDLTAEWCLYRASLSETYAEYLIRRDRLDVAKFHRKSAIIYRIAARVLDEQTFAKTYDILKEFTFTFTDETGDVSVVGIGHAAEAVLAYLKGETS